MARQMWPWDRTLVSAGASKRYSTRRFGRLGLHKALIEHSFRPIAAIGGRRRGWSTVLGTVAALAVVVFVETGNAAGQRAHLDAVDTPASPLDLTSVTFGQQDDRIVLRLATAADWHVDQLTPGAGRSICVKLFYGALRTPRARVCVLGSDAAPQLRYTRLDHFGHPFRIRTLAAQISRPDTRSLQASLTVAGARLHSGRYSWQAQTQWTDADACATAGACDDRAPDNGNVIAHITPPISTLVGCDARGAPLRRFGPRTSANVALTFDDGPSQYTPIIVHILEHKHIPATFFLVGNAVQGHRALLHRMLRDGFMIGNHTLSHANVAGGGAFAAGQIVTTQAIIRRATGFTPCLFRPPYGATSDALTAVVHGLGAMSILWDVDPRDWSTPGSSTIVSTVLHQTRRGSIILLHDGGGPRGQTVAALTTIIDTLQARGLHFVTVDQLLHLHTRKQ